MERMFFSIKLGISRHRPVLEDDGLVLRTARCSAPDVVARALSESGSVSGTLSGVGRARRWEA
ncbi:MAG: hypothetical protein ACFB9M_10070 [Myxococcota bacterium]